MCSDAGQIQGSTPFVTEFVTEFRIPSLALLLLDSWVKLN